MSIVFIADADTGIFPVMHFPARPMVVLQTGFWKPFVQSKGLGAAMTVRGMALRMRREYIVNVV